MATKPISNQSLAVSRYTDLEGEPVTRLLAPISGYQDEPLVPLEEAIKPIAHFFDGIEGNAWVAKHNCPSPADGLSQDMSAAIHLYTMQFGSEPSLYRELNKSLRTENRQALKPWFPFLKLFLTALHTLPSKSMNVWRGVCGVDLRSKYPTGSKFAFIPFMIPQRPVTGSIPTDLKEITSIFEQLKVECQLLHGVYRSTPELTIPGWAWPTNHISHWMSEWQIRRPTFLLQREWTGNYFDAWHLLRSHRPTQSHQRSPHYPTERNITTLSIDQTAIHQSTATDQETSQYCYFALIFSRTFCFVSDPPQIPSVAPSPPRKYS